LNSSATALLNSWTPWASKKPAWWGSKPGHRIHGLSTLLGEFSPSGPLRKEQWIIHSAQKQCIETPCFFRSFRIRLRRHLHDSPGHDLGLLWTQRIRAYIGDVDLYRNGGRFCRHLIERLLEDVDGELHASLHGRFYTLWAHAGASFFPETDDWKDLLSERGLRAALAPMRESTLGVNSLEVFS